MDCSLLGSSVHGIFQARVLEWVAISSSGDLPDLEIKPRSPAFQADALPSKLPGKPSCLGLSCSIDLQVGLPTWCGYPLTWMCSFFSEVKSESVSCSVLSDSAATPWTVACQAPQSMGFLGLPWWLRWWRICPQCRKPEFDPWVRRISWRKACNPLHYSCLENPMGWGIGQAAVHGVPESRTRLSDWHSHLGLPWWLRR